MKTILKKVYTIIVLITNVLIRRKHYKLHFVAETSYPFTRHLDAPHLDLPTVKRWYYDFKHWGFSHDNLEMVAGADHLCEYYAHNKDEVTVNIVATNKPLKNEQGYDKYVSEELKKEISFIDKLTTGRTYYKHSKDGKQITTMWICPVTLFVLGRYPKYIYIKQ